MERIGTSEIFTNADLWKSVESSWPNIIIKNKDKIDGKKITVCIVACPLYATGSLEDSDIIKSPQKIEDSRVFGKISAYSSVLKTLGNYLNSTDGELSVNLIIANKGILLGRKPTEEDYNTLNYHNSLYNGFIKSLSKDIPFKYKFSDYFENNVDYPHFVNMHEPIPGSLKTFEDKDKKETHIIIDYINRYLNLPNPIINNKDNRHILKGLINNYGLNGTFWIVTGYLAFDYKIPEILGENGIYVVAERFDPLFSIAHLTPSLDVKTRIQLKA